MDDRTDGMDHADVDWRETRPDMVLRPHESRLLRESPPPERTPADSHHLHARRQGLRGHHMSRTITVLYARAAHTDPGDGSVIDLAANA